MGKFGKIKGLKWKILDLVIMAVFVILSIDILYLYYNGAWYDPYRFIEISEVLLLYALSILGIIRIILKLRELKRHLSYS
jgi:peptidoglycan biosynthesis protein MviN/MurJ (putative lipid II flippase)